MPSQVAATRSRKRSAAARNSEKNTTSGGPRFTVAVSPGDGKAIETCSKIPGRSSTTYSVGPAATDQMSTHGTSTATSAIHHSSSKSVRNQKPASAKHASLAMLAVASAPTSVRATARAPAATASPMSGSDRSRASGSASQMAAANAGKTTTAWNAMSIPDGRPGRRPAIAP